MMIDVTYWPSTTDPRGRRAKYYPHGLVRVFDAAAKRPHDGRGWSPATFKKDKRNDESTEKLFAIGIDCEHEDKKCRSDPQRVGCPYKLKDRLVSFGWAGIVHTTRNHRADAPRSRAIVFLSRPVNASEYGKLWTYIAEIAEKDLWENGVLQESGLRVDRLTKNVSRLWYLPSVDAEFMPGEVLEVQGVPLDVDLVLAALERETSPVSRDTGLFSEPRDTRPGTAGDLEKRARTYVDAIPGAVSGDGGHAQTFAAARALVSFVDKGLPESDALAILDAYNRRCQPPWSSKELDHKWQEALTKAHTLPALEDRPMPNGLVSRDTRPSSEPSEPPVSRDTRPLTDLGNAERLHDAHGADLLCVAGIGRHVWTGKLWAPDETREWDRRAQQTVRALYDSVSKIDDPNIRKATSEWARKSESREKLTAMCALAETAIGVTVSTDKLDVDHYALNVQNGTLNLRTGELHPHRREDLITRIASCDYVENATCPTFDRFMETTFAGNQELIGFLQRFIGYCLTGSVKEQALVFGYGEGANGKSTLIDLVIDMLGGLGGYASPAAPGLLIERKNEQHPTELADLRGRRLVTCVEIGDGKRFDEERVKALTGSDAVKARYMHKNHFTFAPTHKFILAANHKPMVRGVDPAIWRRILLVPFLVTFTESQKDRDLPAKLRAELPGILAWAVRGCLEWQRVGLKPPEAVAEATNAYRAEQDVVGRFLADRCILSPHVKATSAALYQAFRDWCTEQGEHEITQRRFAEQLQKRNLVQTRMTGGTRAWDGVGILTTAAHNDAVERRFAS